MRKLAFLLFLACNACTTGAEPQQPTAGHSYAERLGRAPPSPAAPAANGTLDQIRALVGTPACSEASQCHSLALGAKACGGPESYLAWSSSQTSGDALRKLADRYKAEREAQSAGRLSDCRFMVDPGAVCVAGRCQLGAAQPAAM